MSHGGKRQGSGRKVGVPSAKTVQRRKIAEEVAAAGILPVEYMLKVMRDPAVDYGRRDEMAKAAAPYIHSRLSSTAVDVTGKVTLETLVTESLKGSPSA